MGALVREFRRVATQDHIRALLIEAKKITEGL
jgi:hypothetical protein